MVNIKLTGNVTALYMSWLMTFVYPLDSLVISNLLIMKHN
jgi:hypothetical protein